MSLPSRPNRPVAGGLPSGPRRPSAARTNDRPSEPSSSSARVVRPQRSLAQLPTRVQPNDEDYDTLPSAPRSRTRSTAGRDERSAGRERPPMPSQRDSGYGSASSTSGSGSAGTSFLDRMRVRSSDTTPRTSIDDDRATQRKPARSRRRDFEEEDQYDDDDRRERRRDHRKSVAAQAAAQGDGSWIWSTVAAAAGNLTLNINKAWTTKVAIYSGEETPPGEESRLTRAMKAYHLEKTQRPSDLPDWLFPASERRAPRSDADQDQVRSRQDDRSRSRVDEGYDDDEPPAPRGRGLRDIYASAAREVAPPTARPSTRAAASAEDGPAPSRAANRLKALRDAKRAAAGVREPSPEPAREAPAPSAPVVRPRVGLPTGPGRVRRPQ